MTTHAQDAHAHGRVHTRAAARHSQPRCARPARPPRLPPSGARCGTAPCCAGRPREGRVRVCVHACTCDGQTSSQQRPSGQGGHTRSARSGTCDMRNTLPAPACACATSCAPHMRPPHPPSRHLQPQHVRVCPRALAVQQRVELALQLQLHGQRALVRLRRCKARQCTSACTSPTRMRARMHEHAAWAWLPSSPTCFFCASVARCCCRASSALTTTAFSCSTTV